MDTNTCASLISFITGGLNLQSCSFKNAVYRKVLSSGSSFLYSPKFFFCSSVKIGFCFDIGFQFFLISVGEVPSFSKFQLSAALQPGKKRNVPELRIRDFFYMAKSMLFRNLLSNSLESILRFSSKLV